MVSQIAILLHKCYIVKVSTKGGWGQKSVHVVYVCPSRFVEQERERISNGCIKGTSALEQRGGVGLTFRGPGLQAKVYNLGGGDGTVQFLKLR